MKIRQLLVVSAVSVVAASASAFEWAPAIQQPNPSLDITQTYVLETMRFYADSGLATTDVMPKWIDEDGNEISGTVSSFSYPSRGEYIYDFSLASFKSNGDYQLLFPEGMLKNAAGELSDPKEFWYTVEIPALASSMFDDFEVLSVSPDFSQPQGLWDEQVVTINTNHNDAIGLTQLFVTDNTTGESVTISSNFTIGRNLGDSSEISWTVVGSFKFYEGHDYTAEFVFYNGLDEVSSEGFPTPVVARQTYEFTGKVEGYNYSDLTLLSITPESGTTISELSQAVFTYTFSGPVNIYKVESPMGLFGKNTYPASCLSSNEDKTVWTLNLSEDEYLKSVDAELVIYIYARDLDGSQLRGDDGEDNNSYFVGQWPCNFGGRQIVIVNPQNGQTIDSLSDVVVSSDGEDTMTWSWVGEAYIKNNDNGQILGTLVPEINEDAQAATEFHFNKILDNATWQTGPLNITTPGSYTIYFGPGCFVYGEEFSSVNSMSASCEFQIAGSVSGAKEELEYYSVYPEMGSEVESISQIVLTFSEPVTCEDFEVNVYTVARSLVATGIGRTDYSEPNVIVLEFNEPIVEEGRYEVVVPSNVIINGDYYESNGAKSLYNPEYRFYYTVAPNEDPVNPGEQDVFFYISVTPESGSTVTELSEISLTYPDVVMTLDDMAWVYNDKNEVVSTASVNWVMEDEFMIKVELSSPIKEDGEYVVVILPETICNIDYADSDGKQGIYNPEIRLTYTVNNDGTGVVSVEDVVNSDVFDVQGRVVLRNASSSDLKTLSKGIYVVGGKKLVVK